MVFLDQDCIKETHAVIVATAAEHGVVILSFDVSTAYQLGTLSETVHMRQPLRLWRELGPRGFLTVQILFLGTLSQFVLAPLLWSFWVVPFGIWHPVMAVLPVWGVYALAAIFFASEIATVAVAALSVATPRHRGLIWWVPLMHLYWPLAALASWKSFAELFWRPFFWDKTAHGTSLGARAAA